MLQPLPKRSWKLAGSIKRNNPNHQIQPSLGRFIIPRNVASSPQSWDNQNVLSLMVYR